MPGNPHADRNHHDYKISLSLCRKISYLTQFVVFSGALVTFIITLMLSINKWTNAQTVESKESIYMDKAWFKFAICLRPFMTPSILGSFYRNQKDKSIQNLTAHLQHLHKLHPRQVRSHNTPWLDSVLKKHDFETYFEMIHPWEKMRASDLWTFQHANIQKAFQEFKVNKMRLTQQIDPQLGSSNDGNSYTVLRNYSSPAAARADSTLLGDYSFSPLYAGCLNITVNETMSKRQMEVKIKFREAMNDRNVGKNDIKKKLTLFKGADVFVYGVGETFTDLSRIQQLTKYSIRAHSLERLFVKGASYQRQSTVQKPCQKRKGYSQTNCRYWCIIRKMLSKLKCTLPWMKQLLEKPWLHSKHKQLPECSTAESFLDALNIEHQFLHLTGHKRPDSVSNCLMTICPVPCTTFKVELLSLGSKSIGNNYGLSLTVSPEVDTVREHSDYTVLTMIAEMNATASFLLGLSVIAIYDWLIALTVWAAVRTGLYTPTDERESGNTMLLPINQEDQQDKKQGLFWHGEPSKVEPEL